MWSMACEHSVARVLACATPCSRGNGDSMLEWLCWGRRGIFRYIPTVASVSRAHCHVRSTQKRFGCWMEQIYCNTQALFHPRYPPLYQRCNAPTMWSFTCDRSAARASVYAIPCSKGKDESRLKWLCWGQILTGVAWLGADFDTFSP